MIKAVLLDLDDTLIVSQTMEMFAAYLRSLGQYSVVYGDPEIMARNVMAAFDRALHAYDPAHALMDRFFAEFSAILEVGDTPELRQFYENFYFEEYPDIVRRYVRVQQGAVELLRLLSRRGLKIVVATNPVLPEIAARCRLEQGGLPSDKYPFEFITALENMHFGKPQPEYYEEILLRLDVESSEVVMIGDSWEHDIVPSRLAGLNTYWVSHELPGLADDGGEVDGSGTIEELVSLIESGWLKRLKPLPQGPQGFVHRLAAFPASIDSLIAGNVDALLECKPDESAWSVRDIVCHLRDHEREEDRVRLQRIVHEEIPFLSGNYNPWEHTDDYINVTTEEALRQFISDRAWTVEWIRALPDEVWGREARHAIFGKTTFEEMVRFATEHDRTHYRQMVGAIKNAREVCGEIEQR